MRRKLFLFLSPIAAVLLETGLAILIGGVFFPKSTISTTIVVDAVMAALLIGWYAVRRQRAKRKLQGQDTAREWKKPAVHIGLLALIQVPIWLVCQLAATYIITNYPELYETTSSAFEQASSWEYVILVVFLAPLVEELLFRGLFYGNYEKLFGFVPAALISAAVFAYMHGNLPQGIVTLILGLFYACVVRQTGTVWATVILHMIANMMDTLSSVLRVPLFFLEPWFWATGLGIIAAGLVVWMVYLVKRKDPPPVMAPAGTRKVKAADDAL